MFHRAASDPGAGGWLLGEPGFVGGAAGFGEGEQAFDGVALGDPGGDELFLAFLFGGGGQDLGRETGRQYDHAVGIADDDVAGLDGDARAGHGDAGFPRDVAPAEDGRVDRGVIDGEIEGGQRHAVPDGAVGDNARRASDPAVTATSTTSPGFTTVEPPGVPVRITSPGCSVTSRDRSATMSPKPNSMSWAGRAS